MSLNMESEKISFKYKENLQSIETYSAVNILMVWLICVVSLAYIISITDIGKIIDSIPIWREKDPNMKKQKLGIFLEKHCVVRESSTNYNLLKLIFGGLAYTTYSFARTHAIIFNFLINDWKMTNLLMGPYKNELINAFVLNILVLVVFLIVSHSIVRTFKNVEDESDTSRKISDILFTGFICFNFYLFTLLGLYLYTKMFIGTFVTYIVFSWFVPFIIVEGCCSMIRDLLRDESEKLTYVDRLFKLLGINHSSAGSISSSDHESLVVSETSAATEKSVEPVRSFFGRLRSIASFSGKSVLVDESQPSGIQTVSENEEPSIKPPVIVVNDVDNNPSSLLEYNNSSTPEKGTENNFLTIPDEISGIVKDVQFIASANTSKNSNSSINETGSGVEDISASQVIKNKPVAEEAKPVDENMKSAAETKPTDENNETEIPETKENNIESAAEGAKSDNLSTEPIVEEAKIVDVDTKSENQEAKTDDQPIVEEFKASNEKSEIPETKTDDLPTEPITQEAKSDNEHVAEEVKSVDGEKTQDQNNEVAESATEKVELIGSDENAQKESDPIQQNGNETAEKSDNNQNSSSQNLQDETDKPTINKPADDVELNDENQDKSDALLKSPKSRVDNLKGMYQSFIDTEKIESSPIKNPEDN